MVASPHSYSRASSAIVSPAAYRSAMRLRWPASSAVGWPNLVPLRLARSIPSSQRLRIRLRSNSAIPPMIVITSLPTSVVVSHQLSPEGDKATVLLLKLMQDVVQVTARSRQAVQLQHQDGVTRYQRLHQPVELPPAIGGLPRCLLAENLPAPSSLQRLVAAYEACMRKAGFSQGDMNDINEHR